MKYLVDEDKASAIRAFLMNHMEPDAYTKPDQRYGYSVRSLYLDTPDFSLMRKTLEGHKNRFKLRIRFYDDSPASPAFLEIKRRENDVIRKERAAVTREGVQWLLEGRRPDMVHLIRGDNNSAGAMHNFCSLCDRVGATGAVFVIYVREAYMSLNSDELRVTFDRFVESRKYHPGRSLVMPSTGIRPKIQIGQRDAVILEIKFTDRFPHWTGDMVHAFDLQRQSMPKYVECLDATRRQELTLLGL